VHDAVSELALLGGEPVRRKPFSVPEMRAKLEQWLAD
jgi:hypothetical protein